MSHGLRVISNFQNNCKFLFTDVQELDITKFDATQSFVKENKRDIIINSTAYINVDKAEDDAEMTDLIIKQL